MQHLHPDPPIVVESRERIAVSIAREELLPTLLVEKQFAITVQVSQSPCCGFAGTVNLRAVPPGCIGVFIAWTLDVGLTENLVRFRTWQLHLAVRPIVTFRKWNVVTLVTLQDVSNSHSYTDVG